MNTQRDLARIPILVKTRLVKAGGYHTQQWGGWKPRMSGHDRFNPNPAKQVKFLCRFESCHHPSFYMSEPIDPLKAGESAVDAISKFTGLSKPVMDEIWQKVKANLALLATCKGHDFSLPFEKRGQMVVKWKCSKCGGTVDTFAKKWYEQGLKHGLSRG